MLASPDGRWIEEPIENPAAFYAAHPECVVTADRLDGLEGWIAKALKEPRFLWYRNTEADEEISAQIRMRIIEAATGYRYRDALTGKAVYDYLEGADSYIVRHAANAVFIRARRERASEQELRPCSLETVMERTDGGEDTDGGAQRRLETMLADDSGSAEAKLAGSDALELFIALVSERLSPAERRVFEQLVSGDSRPQAAERLGLRRQTVHIHMQKIREAARDAQRVMADPPSVAVRRTSTLNRHLPSARERRAAEYRSSVIAHAV